MAKPSFTEKDRQRLLSKISISADGCWRWQAAANSLGYGRTYVQGKLWVAHRAFYTMFVGSIPDGLVLDHLCRNPSCCNPEHLEPVTSRENILRGVGASARNAKAEACMQGHAWTPENTHIDPRGHRKCRACNRNNLRRWRAARLIQKEMAA